MRINNTEKGSSIRILRGATRFGARVFLLIFIRLLLVGLIIIVVVLIIIAIVILIVIVTTIVIGVFIDVMEVTMARVPIASLTS